MEGVVDLPKIRLTINDRQDQNKTMAETSLEGPFNLAHHILNEMAEAEKPGTYVLGYVDAADVFIVRYVGRADTNLIRRLRDWVGQYEMFKASIFQSAEEAYEHECRIYHDFGENQLLDNEIHPAKPEGVTWACPYPGCQG